MIAIIGAGISGLSVAYHLQKNGIPYQVFEASDRAGGVIQTAEKKGYLLELGPNSLLCDQETLRFIGELGLNEELLPAAEVNKNRYVFKKGKYRKLPSSPPDLLFNSFFGWKTKFRIFKERNIASRSPQNESVHAFFERRFGKVVTDWAVNPFISGIYAGDPHKLLIEKTFPLMANLEKEHGSIIRGMMKRKGGTGRKATYSFQKGLSSLPKRMAEKLSIQFNSPVKHLKRQGEKWELVLDSKIVGVDKVVLCLPPHRAAKLFAPYFPDVAAPLSNVDQPAMLAVHTVFRRADVKHALNGFGGLNPKVANRFAAGSIWSSSIFPNRCRPDQVLLTSFVGGTQYQQNTSLSDADVVADVVAELKEAYHILGDPQYTHLHRWEKSIPQYDADILPALAAAEKMEALNLFVCANWKGGVSVIDCLQKGKDLADKISE